MATISPVSVSNVKTPNFKGIKTTEKGNSYHHTNVGTAVGGTVAGLSILEWLIVKASASAAKDMPQFAEYSKKIGKYGYAFMGIAAAASLGCGMLVDHLRNKKAKETADEIAINPNAINTSDNMEYSEVGLPYFKTKTGTKLGALLGAACGLAHSMMIGTKKTSSILNAALTVAEFALGGLAMGAITDKITNNKSKKAALEMHLQRPTIK